MHKKKGNERNGSKKIRGKWNKKEKNKNKVERKGRRENEVR